MNEGSAWLVLNLNRESGSMMLATPWGRLYVNVQFVSKAEEAKRRRQEELLRGVGAR